ncbi:adipogenin isoform X2 [Manacus vitellinus]|uniref:adipogenin isoform X2 n=1 Tax=Manacus vitellinus TaxID=328815 RepID=UPI000847111B|nr:adipogenin isoform X2 [Manacus vitellinus]XP_051659027.1 adipogenin isoform X2 [Manacus candei]
MRYPLVPLVNELTFPLLFFWFCLPFVMLLIIMIIWLQLLLNEAQMPSTEKIKKESFDEPDSDSIFEDELTEEDNQSDASSTETQEESQPSDSAGRLRPKPAYLSSNPKSQKQSLLAVTSNSWSRSQKIRYSHVEKSNFCNIMMIFNVLRILLLPSYLITYMAQLFALLYEKAVKILDSLRLESRGLLASVLGRKLELSKAQRTTRG